jgi:hypothetical protein
VTPANWSTSDDIDWSTVVHDYEVRGMTMEQIAAEYGCSTFPVFLELHERGAKIRKPGPGMVPKKMADRELRNRLIYQESLTGVTQQQQAQTWGLSVSMIQRIIYQARR